MIQEFMMSGFSRGRKVRVVSPTIHPISAEEQQAMDDLFREVQTTDVDVDTMRIDPLAEIGILKKRLFALRNDMDRESNSDERGRLRVEASRVHNRILGIKYKRVNAV